LVLICLGSHVFIALRAYANAQRTVGAIRFHHNVVCMSTNTSKI
jgi:hypothetical protein